VKLRTPDYVMVQISETTFLACYIVFAELGYFVGIKQAAGFIDI